MNSLSLPSLDYSALERADLAAGTRRNYTSALQQLFETGIDPFDYSALANYAATLPASVRSNLKAALSHMTTEYEHQLQAGATIDNLPQTQVLLLRIQALNNAIQVHASTGRSTPIWLSPAQVEQITQLPDRSTLRGRRDWIILATLLATGLRRDEMANLTFDQIKHQPMKGGSMRGVLAIIGKGRKKRSLPIQPLLKQRLEEWKAETGGGRVARKATKGNTLTESLSGKAINDIVSRYGALIGVPDLEAHDLRRTYAQIGWDNTHDLIRVMVSLGHSSPSVTQKYLNLDVDIEMTISDYVPISGD